MLRSIRIIIGTATILFFTRFMLKTRFLRQVLATASPLNYFLFHLRLSFGSQDTHIFVLNFWSCSKTAWLDQVNIKLHEVATELTNNCYCPISREEKTIKLENLVS